MSSPPDDDELHRAAILARRSRFVALALMGATTAVSATACACLSPRAEPDAGSQDSGPDGEAADSGGEGEGSARDGAP